ncbi:DMT family transporter [Tranquillimonas rosea]|uniref:DMT family transporter n=1 Tax=Tranquillimonas rosea TaxID=641238 RepID=UPI003BA99456
MQNRPLSNRIPTGWIALGAAGAAVVLWGCLPALRLMIGDQPPFLTATIALVAAAVMETLRSWGVVLRHPELDTGHRPLSFGRGLGLALGLIGAIGFYFIGLDRAPAAQVTLITYVWPLMFVMASEVLDTGRLRALAICGGAVAFLGSAVLILGTGSGAVTADRVMGYAAGLLSGLSWVVYSLMLKRGGQLGPDAWPRIFTLAAVGAGLCHFALEPVALTFDPRGFAVAAAIGLGPYGIAFIAWAYGVAKGPSRTVGTLAYGVPVVATALLASIGATELTWKLLLGATLVMGGIVIASRNDEFGMRLLSLIPRRPRRTAP